MPHKKGDATLHVNFNSFFKIHFVFMTWIHLYISFNVSKRVTNFSLCCFNLVWPIFSNKLLVFCLFCFFVFSPKRISGLLVKILSWFLFSYLVHALPLFYKVLSLKDDIVLIYLCEGHLLLYDFSNMIISIGIIHSSKIFIHTLIISVFSGANENKKENEHFLAIAIVAIEHVM